MIKRALLAGYGRFGRLFHSSFSGEFTFAIHDPRKGLYCSEEQFNRAEFLFLSIPISSLEQFLHEHRQAITPATVVVDLFSVKEYPLRMLRDALPENLIIGTHPLFGPDSAAGGLAGHQIVMVPESTPSPAWLFLEKAFNHAGLRVIPMNAEDHDRHMAWTLCLTQFIGRGLETMPMPGNGIGTKGYFDLLDIVNRAKADTPVLFEDMNRYNRFAGDMRTAVRSALQDLDERLARMGM